MPSNDERMERLFAEIPQWVKDSIIKMPPEGLPTEFARFDEGPAMSDNGLPTAVARVAKARQDHGLNLMDERCRCGWGDSADYDAYLAHRDEAVARAAREDVAETVREARAAELEAFADWIDRHKPHPDHVAADARDIAASTRAGEA